MNKALSLVVVLILLLSCTLMPTPELPAAPIATNVIGFTKTPAPAPTNSPSPTETFAVPNLNAFETLAVADGFTISVPFPLLHQVDGNFILIGNEEGTLTVSFTSDTFGSSDTLDDVLNRYLGSLERRGWEFTRSEPTEIEIDGATGILVDLLANAQSMNFEGQAVAVSPRADFVLFGLGIIEINAEPNSWKTSGQETFRTLMGNIEFTEADGKCPISTDATYGYSEENPIRVGGDFISGVSRERAYLDHLRGPHGEALSYERQGSLPSGDTILDIYNITGSGVDKILYVDLYNFSEPYAPVGFTCEGPFPLSAP